MPVKSDPLIITSPFGSRIDNGKKIFHPGVDLRTVNKQTGQFLDIIAPENIEVLRNGIDGYGNYFLVGRPEESPFKELKFIHLDEKCLSFNKDEHIQKGSFLGHSRIGGNSKLHHLHFEVWAEEAIDPVKYFEFMGKKWKNA